MAKDPGLGWLIHEELNRLEVETPILGSTLESHIHEVVEEAQSAIMKALELDLTDDSLAETPARVAKMYATELFYGLDYTNFPKATAVENKFNVDEMVAVSKITVQSMCEHHFLPFIGNAAVAYIPNHKVLGLSKFNRIVDFFCHRPQIQERLTEQIAGTLRYILETDDVAVVITAEHYCTKLRGIKDGCSSTTTSKMMGKFRDVPSLRQEFLALTR